MKGAGAGELPETRNGAFTRTLLWNELNDYGSQQRECGRAKEWYLDVVAF